MRLFSSPFLRALACCGALASAACGGTDSAADADGDGHRAVSAGGDDCDDTNPDISPSAIDIPYDGIDQDCIGGDLDDVDRDGAKGGANGTDCDDRKPDVHPGAIEVCNGQDDDCDLQIDEEVTTAFYRDADGDGFGSSETVQACQPPAGYVARGGDCNDADAAIHPGAQEICDAADVDEDCNGSSDDGDTGTLESSKTRWYPDADRDGHGAAASAGALFCDDPKAQGADWVTSHDDCDDASAAVHPGAAESCNGADDDCDGETDEGVTSTFFRDADGDGFGAAANSIQRCTLISGYVADDTDCDDTDDARRPGLAEVCDDKDNDCDGQIDQGLATSQYYVDADADGYGSASGQPLSSCRPVSGRVTDHTDCNDANASIHPGVASDVCNGADDDCDGEIDEDPDKRFYRDADGDGFGDPASSVLACSAPFGYVADRTDCNDTRAQANPGAVEVADGIDNDCDGLVDEGVYFTSCLDLRNRSLVTQQSGVFTIDPDGAGSVQPFAVYCDMTTNDAGWTLVLKANGASATFGWGSSHWTANSTVSPTSTALDTNEAKLHSFNTVGFTQVRVTMLDAGVKRPVTINKTGNSLLAVMQGGFQATALGRNAWKGLMASPSLQPYCNAEGFNVQCAGTNVRIGIASNQEADCGSCDSRIGVGGEGTNCGQDPANSVGNEAFCSADAGDRSTKAFAYVFVR